MATTAWECTACMPEFVKLKFRPCRISTDYPFTLMPEALGARCFFCGHDQAEWKEVKPKKKGGK